MVAFHCYVLSRCTLTSAPIWGAAWQKQHPGQDAVTRVAAQPDSCLVALLLKLTSPFRQL